MKSHLKGNLILVLLFVNFNLTWSQDNGIHHRKYWWYKSRLNNDFVKVGLADGESMPLNQRGDNFVNSSVDMRIGDGASTLGHYIALLATEYALLRKNQQNTDKVKHELFCALNAVNRLDYKAEQLTHYGVNLLNGFFIRDDVPGDFLKTQENYSHFNYYSDWNGTLENWGDVPENINNTSSGFHSKIENKGMFKVISDWSRKNDPTNIDEVTISMSQDQVYMLLWGIAFINKFVPDWETDNNQAFPYTGETKLVKEARSIANRIISHMREPKDQNGNEINASNFDKLVNSWKIKNPLTGIEVTATDGGDARPFAYALGESSCLISNNSNSAANYANLLNIPLACPGGGHHNALSLNPAGYNAWNLFASTNLYLPDSAFKYVDTRNFITTMSAVCNCVYSKTEHQYIETIIKILTQSPVTNWIGTIIGWTWKLIEVVNQTMIPGYYKNVTGSAITANAYNYESPFDHGPISHALLHGYPTYITNPQYSFNYLLDVAPCDGIYNFGINNQSHYEWSSDNRIDHPNRRGQDAGNQDIKWTTFKGEYNGIDFMVYHNLYYLYKSNPLGFHVNMTDLSDIYINNPNNINCTNVNAYETITSENTNISCNTETYWRAGKTIYFGPGTSITGQGSSTGGPNFHAYIQKFECATDVGAYKSGIANVPDSYEQGAQYHTVNYPPIPNNIKDNYLASADENLITELPPETDPFEEAMKKAYPNYTKELFVKPTITKGEVRAYFSLDDNESAYLTVTDIQGKIVYQKTNITNNDNGILVNIENEAVGVYLLKFTSTNGINKTEKIIKE